MQLAWWLLLLAQFALTPAMYIFYVQRNISTVAIALSEIVSSLKPRQLAILAPTLISTTNATISTNQLLENDFSDFIYKLHKLNVKSIIFYDIERFYAHIEHSLVAAIECVNFIFAPPFELSVRLQEKRLVHRLSLFMFYWGAKQQPHAKLVRFEEPMRAVVITRPRALAFRIYYNQAVPDGVGNLRLVNWYDGANLGLHKLPLLPSALSVYANCQGRVFRVPVFHSPPWFWVNYDNDNDTEANNYSLANTHDYTQDGNADAEFTELNVTGGRDHSLLQLLAKHMNFQYVYVEAPGRTQGALRADSNDSFTGAIGQLQNGFADLLLGDVSLSWERRKAVEFTFFTLADSGAFATHAPRRLNEAFAIVRPFKRDVWPYLILTMIFSGPLFYAIIAMPYRWRSALELSLQPNDAEGMERGCGGHITTPTQVICTAEGPFHMAYISEITRHAATSRRRHCRRLAHMQHMRLARIDESTAVKPPPAGHMPARLFERCIWFTVQLFLKQSCQELYHGYRAKFLMIVYWIAATYVLADVYSAQLTSQFARPPHEAPLNTLARLQRAMQLDGYQLYVEKESSSLEMLENGTEVFRKLYALMRKQRANDNEDYLIDSVEAGIRLIADGLENKAVLAGRETLYFNIQQFGAKTFQLSQKLYTRYSAVAVQIGCPFLDSLNDVLIHLFEGGILEKMTIAEYETQARMLRKELNDQQAMQTQTQHHTSSNNNNNQELNANENEATAGIGGSGAGVGVGGGETSGQRADNAATQASTDMQIIQPLNLRMLQGAFIVLLVGYGAAGVIWLCELLCHRMNCAPLRSTWPTWVRQHAHSAYRLVLRLLRAAFVRMTR